MMLLCLSQGDAQRVVLVGSAVVAEAGDVGGPTGQ